ncbi:unnamed protein product [Bursaphelenchus xylophilus]|uniref:(pine wood nematode) hypothetical protein n=1 Tax=Bursaphelenchus xylophilus TaxID=6326 RepID=A0A1I7SW91_BURXY|nr:unnamed protein product [Bursaphelenchus xylophilus]CAG9099022.1 unnamed protein product [Bursaphelenchus xylophilus]
MHTVNLTCYNTRETEVLSALTSALDSLFSTSSQIFNKVEERINECQTRLNGYQRRFQAITENIETLQEMENPVIIYVSEFPRTHITERKLVITKPSHTKSPLITAPSRITCTPEQFLKTRKVNSVGNIYKFNEENHKANMLFNMEMIRVENILLRAKNVSNSGRALEKVEDDILRRSLLATEQEDVAGDDEFEYKQPSESPTEFDLPDILPGIEIQNISMFGNDEFSDDDEDMFGASSTHKTSSNSREPSAFDLTESPRKIDIVLEEKKETPDLATHTQPKEVVSQPSLSPVSPPPPPPPPPPPTLFANVSPPPIAGRSSLMEAIRAAGGADKAKLKKITAEKVVEESPKPSVSQGDDLMGSLAKALEKRRKGISGNTKKKFDALEKRSKGPGPSLFSSMREVINTKVNHDNSSGSEEEEDWN